MLSIASIALICCCLLGIVSAAPLEHGHHHHEKPIHQEHGIKHESDTKPPAGNHKDHSEEPVSAPKPEPEIHSPTAKGSPKSPKSPKAYDPEKVARAVASKVYGEKLKKMPKKKALLRSDSMMQKEWAQKLSYIWESDEAVQANVEPWNTNSLEEDIRHGVISAY